MKYAEKYTTKCGQAALQKALKEVGGDKLINLNGLPSAPTPDAERLQRDRENEMNDYFLRLAARDAALRKALAAISNTRKGAKDTEKQEENTDKSTK